MLYDGFVDSERRHARRPAAAIAGRGISYEALGRLARRFAAGLLELCDNPRRVGILTGRDDVSYAAVLGTSLAGAAFVPLNSAYPPERLRAIAAAARLDAVVVAGAGRRHLPHLLDLRAAPRVLLADGRRGEAGVPGDALDDERLRRLPPLDRPVPRRSDDAAYLMFTSGTTGAPKGVPITHANADHFLRVVSARYGLTAEDRFSQLFEHSFDLSVFDLFAAWGAGACTCTLSPVAVLRDAAGVVARTGLTVWFSTPSLATEIERRGLAPAALPGLRLSLFCGEALTEATAAAWSRAAPNSVLENLYGPTEATVACAAYRWPGLGGVTANEVVPIGDVHPGLSALLLADAGAVELRDAGTGVEGELCLAGPQVFAGYWDAAGDDRCFVTHAGRRYYRTGDRVRTAETGLRFLGRVDDQVKVRGYRVELGDVEHALRQADGVDDAVAVTYRHGCGDTELAAFVLGRAPDPARALARARRILPPYAVPSRVQALTDPPRNANGKIDRTELQRRLES
jgi:amino acid adenylation domain-containing protein